MLLDFFFDLEDFRRAQGKQYELGHVLHFSVLAILPMLLLLLLSAILACITIIHAEETRSDIATTAEKKPNIVLILADDVGTGDIPLYWNSSLVHMPNIDRLAKMGVTF